DVPASPNAIVSDRVRLLMRSRGARVALTGIGGDEWLGTTPWAYADLLRNGRVTALAARVRGDAALDDFVGWRAALKATTWPLVPSFGKRVVRRILGRGDGPAWMNPRFVQSIG